MTDFDKDCLFDHIDNKTTEYNGKHICMPFYQAVHQCQTAAQAIRLFKTEISWALQTQYVTAKDLLTFTDSQTLGDNSVFIDKTFNNERIDNHVCCVFLNCRGSIRVGLNVAKAIIPMLYLSENSELTITVEDNVTVPCELYHGSKVATFTPYLLKVSDYSQLKTTDCERFTDNNAAIIDLNNEEL